MVKFLVFCRMGRLLSFRCWVWEGNGNVGWILLRDGIIFFVILLVCEFIKEVVS